MKNITTKIMIAATTLMVAASCATAQTLKAEIPFNFRVSDKVMPAGNYQLTDINAITGNAIFRISDGHNSVLAVAAGSGDANRSWEAKRQAILTFECIESRCSLAQVYTGSGASAYKIPHPKAGPGEPVRMATVVLHPDKAD